MRKKFFLQLFRRVNVLRRFLEHDNLVEDFDDLANSKNLKELISKYEKITKLTIKQNDIIFYAEDNIKITAHIGTGDIELPSNKITIKNLILKSIIIYFTMDDHTDSRWIEAAIFAQPFIERREGKSIWEETGLEKVKDLEEKIDNFDLHALEVFVGSLFKGGLTSWTKVNKEYQEAPIFLEAKYNEDTIRLFSAIYARVENVQKKKALKEVIIVKSNLDDSKFFILPTKSKNIDDKAIKVLNNAPKSFIKALENSLEYDRSFCLGKHESIPKAKKAYLEIPFDDE